MTKTTLPNTPDSPFQSETEGDLSGHDEPKTNQAPPQPSEEAVDNAVEETFPASDPISP